MLKSLSKIIRVALLLLLVVAVCLPAWAQTASSSQSKKSGASTSCDGALDIVPSKPMTFVRKRRPAKSDAKPQSVPADSKPVQKQPGDSKQGN